MPSLPDLQRLYDRNLFLDAFRLSSEYWKPSTSIQDLSIEELIFGGRLAFRLAGWRLSRRLFRAAYVRDATNPRVRYFANHARRRIRLLDDLRGFEFNPDICAEDPEMQAAWLASHAVTWAFLRDFTTAHSCLDRARSIQERDGWVMSCESDVLGLEDRWSEALKSAEFAWEIDSGTPYAARSLSNSLLNTGRVQEAAERLTAASDHCQSFEIVHLACWYQCALAETFEDDRRRGALDVAQRLAECLPGLMPLADRESRRLIARVHLDIAGLADDHAAMERWAEETRIPFYRRILSNLRQNPTGQRRRLPFTRTIQKHQTCLPTSLASALATVGQQFDPDVMASEITFGGTMEWAAAEWLENRGFTVRFFAVTRETATALIRNGIGFVLTLEGDDNSHAVAAVGLDEAAGTLIIHDPMAYRSAEYLLEGFAKYREPLGIRGMAVVPAQQTQLLDGLLPEAVVALMAAAQDQQKALALLGPSASRAIVNDIEQKLPSHPGTRLLRSIQAAEDGHTGEALLSFQRMLNEFPNSAHLRFRLLAACRARGNTALMRETLAAVVERGILPGVQSQQDWLFPPVRYVAEYADLLSISAETRPDARALLNGLIRRQPQSAEGWHVLGDLHRKQHDIEGALLCYRLASCQASENEHFALTYCDALARNNKQQEGFSWLESRVRKFINTQRAAGTWVSWIRALEVWGQPDRALSVCSEALAHQGAMPELLGFVVPFLARMGRWQEAKEQLGILERTGNMPLFREAAVEFYRLNGDLRRSTENAEDWVRERPHHMGARYALVDLIARRDGAGRALELASNWTSENPGHDELEELRYRQLERVGEPKWKKYSILLRRVKRNPEDGWAWLELAFHCIEDWQRAEIRRQAKFQKRLAALLRECDRTAPEEPATVRAHAWWYQADGQWREAVSGWLDSIERDPSNSYGYHRIWECSAGFEPGQRREFWNTIEPILLRAPGYLSISHEIVPLLAQRFGVRMAEETVTRWNQHRPDDPEIVESLADLLLEHGQGRTDAMRAYELLRPAVDHFPFHLGVRLSLVQACRKLGKVAEAEDGLREIVRRHPENSNARIQLAWVHELNGRGDSARNLLEEASVSDPQNTQFSDALVQVLIRHGQFDQAKRLVLTTLERAPRDVTWRDRAIKLLLECGDEEGAVTAARAGVKIYPRGAYLWFLLGVTLNNLRRFAGPGEIELCFRRSVSLNPVFFDAADLLSVLLAEQRRYEDSENVMLHIRRRLGDSSPAQGRLAWIQRQQGKKQEGRNEMASVVRAHPWYLGGWAQLMDWLLEDKAWDQARELLARVPEEVRTDPRFRRQRLVVLQSAGLPVSELDAEWTELLSDFPEELSLHLHRYDLLQEAKRADEAQAVLNAFDPSDPNNPYYLARLVEVRAQERKLDEAIKVMQDIFYAEAESSAWPADYAWEALKKAQLIDRAYDEACRSLEKQRRPTPEAFSILCSHVLEHAGTQKRIPQTLWSSCFPERGVKEVLRLLKLADGSPWTDPVYRAIVLNRLNSVGHYRLVKNYWKKHRWEVETDVRTWSETGRALASMNHRREARELLSSWRRRKGVSMWMIANYIGCLSALSKSDLEEIVSSSGDALRDLPHDHCARYLAHVRAESYALLGDTQGLLSTWAKYRTYFDCKEGSNEWFQDKRRPLLTDIPMLVRFLEQKQYGLYRRTVWRLRWRHIAGSLVKTRTSTQATRIPWWTWVILLGSSCNF
ncbi:MAG TPA: tetratricopeptide repeat protein [Candidatus Sulfotelmatobacter sp.]|nr:tetratricopeptide repeat protein [Candidatus Sulfotelmatobacter sp.]